MSRKSFHRIFIGNRWRPATPVTCAQCGIGFLGVRQTSEYDMTVPRFCTIRCCCLATQPWKVRSMKPRPPRKPRVYTPRVRDWSGIPKGEKSPMYRHGEWLSLMAKNPTPEARRKHLVRRRFKYAVKAGKIQKQPCERCGAVKAEGHHEDYDKPYDVNWLCRKHHFARHRELDQEARAS